MGGDRARLLDHHDLIQVVGIVEEHGIRGASRGIGEEVVLAAHLPTCEVGLGPSVVEEAPIRSPIQKGPAAQELGARIDGGRGGRVGRGG